MNLVALLRQKPYKATFIKKNVGYTFIFDETELFVLPVSLGIDKIQDVVSAINGAYVEGYLQRERELQAQKTS